MKKFVYAVVLLLGLSTTIDSFGKNSLDIKDVVTPVDLIKTVFQKEINWAEYVTKRFKEFAHYQTEYDPVYDTQDGYYPNETPSIAKDPDCEYIITVSWTQYEEKVPMSCTFLVAKEEGKWKIDNRLYLTEDVNEYQIKNSNVKYQVLFDYSRPVQENLAYDEEEYTFTKESLDACKSVPDFVPEIPSRIIFEKNSFDSKDKVTPVDLIKTVFQKEINWAEYVTKRFKEFAHYQTEYDPVYDTQDGYYPNETPSITKDPDCEYIITVSWTQYEEKVPMSCTFLVAKEEGKWKIDNRLYLTEDVNEYQIKNSNVKYQVLFDYSRPVQENLAYDEEEYTFTKESLDACKSVPDFVPEIPSRIVK